MQSQAPITAATHTETDTELASRPAKPQDTQHGTSSTWREQLEKDQSSYFHLAELKIERKANNTIIMASLWRVLRLTVLKPANAC